MTPGPRFSINVTLIDIFESNNRNGFASFLMRMWRQWEGRGRIRERSESVIMRLRVVFSKQAMDILGNEFPWGQVVAEAFYQIGESGARIRVGEFWFRGLLPTLLSSWVRFFLIFFVADGYADHRLGDIVGRCDIRQMLSNPPCSGLI